MLGKRRRTANGRDKSVDCASLPDPVGKYDPFPTVNLPDRQWPGRMLTKAPRWLASDLRAGNQALHIVRYLSSPPYPHISGC